MTELEAAFGRIEEVARENERLKRDLQEVQGRLRQLSLGLGQVVLYVELAALLREMRDSPSNAIEAALYDQLGRIDRNNWGGKGPTREQQLQALGKSWVQELNLQP